jgi:hypothetical protein
MALGGFGVFTLGVALHVHLMGPGVLPRDLVLGAIGAVCGYALGRYQARNRTTG